MFKTHTAFNKADVSKLLLAVLAVTVMVFAAFSVFDSDESDAETVNGTTYFYDQLNPFEKSIYDAAVNAPITFTDGEYRINFTVPVGDYGGMNPESCISEIRDQVTKTLGIISNERVDMFWLGNSHSISPAYSTTGDVITPGSNFTMGFSNLVVMYGTDEDSVPKLSESKTALQNAVDAIVLEKTDTTYDKVKSINKAIIGLLSYTTERPIPETMDIRNTATAFIGDHIVVCEGYAKAFKLLCDKYNVPCIIVTGNAGTSGPKEPHMWNYVQMDNEKWYLVDSTWNDQTQVEQRERYLLAGTDTIGFDSISIGNSHIPDAGKYSEFSLPTLSSTAYTSEQYKIIFLDSEGSVYSQKDYQATDTVILPAPPSKAPTDTKTYSFSGWSTDGISVIPTLPKVSAATTYVPVFAESARVYTITFNNFDGTPVSPPSNLHFGDSIVAPANPSRAADDYYIYTFSNWSPAVPATVNDSSFDYTFTAEYSYRLNIQEIDGGSVVKVKEDKIRFNTSEMADIKSRPGSLTIEFEGAKFVFDHNAVMGLSADQILKIQKKDTNSIPENYRADHRKATVFDIDFGTNNGAFTSGEATVSIKVKTTDSSNLELFWVNGDEMVPVEFEYTDGSVVFKTNHFSVYVIDGIEDEESDLIEFLIPIFIILIIAAIGMALAYKFS